MPINPDELGTIKEKLITIVNQSLNNLELIVRSRDFLFSRENRHIKPLFYSAFYEYCGSEEGSSEAMNSTIKTISTRLLRSEAIEFEKAGLYGAQLETKIALVNHAWNKFGMRNIIDLKRWVECLKSLMMSILAITGADEALKELFDMITNILSDQVDNQLLQ